MSHEDLVVIALRSRAATADVDYVTLADDVPGAFESQDSSAHRATTLRHPESAPATVWPTSAACSTSSGVTDPFDPPRSSPPAFLP
jgi:hypothetical protein